MLDCPTCHKAKKLDCWLEVETSVKHDVQVEPDGELTKAFVWGQDGVAATRDQVALDAALVDYVEAGRPLSQADLPASVPAEWRAAHWSQIQPFVGFGERVRSQSFALLEVPSTSVTYCVSGEQQTVAFEGLRMLAPPASHDTLFATRARTLARTKIAFASTPIIALAIYLLRGTYYVSERTLPLTLGIGVATAIAATCAYAVVWYATIGRKSAVSWALACIAPTAVAVSLAVLVEPSASRAEAYIAAGNLDKAEFELDALAEASEHESIWAELRLRRALNSSTCADAKAAADKIDSRLPQHARAIAHADHLALAFAEQSLQEGRLDDAESSLGCASDALPEKRPTLAKIFIAAARTCREQKKWDCAFERSRRAGAAGSQEAAKSASDTEAAIQTEFDRNITAARSEKNVAARLAVENETFDLWHTYLFKASAAKPNEIVQLEAARKRDEQALARQVELEKRRAAAEERRRIAAEEHERRRQEAAERRRDYAPLLCGDGSLSPSCTCGGSHRGCCSWHGGVAGCSADD